MSIFRTKVLLATDGSEDATLAARTAVDIVQKTNSEMHVVYVGPFRATFLAATEQEPAQLEREARHLLHEQVKLIEAANGNIEQSHLRMGAADEQIVSVAEEIGAGLIVMGSRGHGGLRRALMGSVSDSVVRHAHCPVLVVRQER
jgi:nucleotide-binding universal stress UspA family protein